jgi:hypothetical protein
MIYYKALDDNFLNYGIQKNNFSKFFDETNKSHMWINHPIENIFTLDGLKFFTDRNISLRETTRIFKLKANFQSEIHIDSDYYDSAFNFVVEGNGTMQWIKVHNGAEDQGGYTQSNNNAGSYKRFPTYDSIDVLDNWSGKCALVRISTPHRMIGGATDRYCISIRPKQEHFFDDLSKIIF